MGSHYRVASSHIRRELLTANNEVIKQLARDLVSTDDKATGKLTVEIKEMKHVLFKNFDDVEFNSNTYYEPSWRTLESIDSLFVIGKILYVVQMTFSPNHPLKTAGLRRVRTDAKKKVPALEGHCVIFAIPDLSAKKGKDLVAKFKHQQCK